MAFALAGCASGGARSDYWADKGILVEKRYAASVARVDSAAARALLDLGYTIARDSGDGNRYVQAAPRATWDDCVRAEIRAASQHPGVVVFVISSREGDSTESNVGAHTLRRVPDVVVGGKQMNADLIVKMCAIIAVSARMDTLLGVAEPIPPAIAAVGDTAQAISVAQIAAYDDLVSRLRSGDTLVDYTAARMAYAITPQYQPYPVRWEGNQAMFAALERRKYAEVRRLSDSILTTNYVDADAHLGAMADGGHAPMRSLAVRSDGGDRSPESHEEHAVFRHLHSPGVGSEAPPAGMISRARSCGALPHEHLETSPPRLRHLAAGDVAP
jgi:hypothetical protein